MNAVDALRQNIQWGHEILEMVMADVTDDQARLAPSGSANPIGALYAHALLSEDGVVNGMLKGGAPRFATEPEQTGVAAPQMNLDLAWARGLQPDLAALRAYKDTLLADVEAYLDTLSDTDLDRTMDLSAVGLGQQTVGWMLNALVAGHLNNMAGEISALKGTQGLRGYPF
jgi:hypothetical protein